MRIETEIITDRDAAQAEYAAIAHASPAPIVRAASERVRALQRELSAHLSAGATPCPDCGAVPIGMQKQPGVYEVGCQGRCTENRPGLNGGNRARGGTSALAVANWNARQWIEATG